MMNVEQIKPMTPNQLSVEFACMVNRLGISDQQDTATIMERDETLLLSQSPARLRLTFVVRVHCFPTVRAGVTVAERHLTPPQDTRDDRERPSCITLVER
jgi:hypothetical protein